MHHVLEGERGDENCQYIFSFFCNWFSNVQPLKGKTTLLKPSLSLGGAAVSGATQSFREAGVWAVL